MTDMGIHHQEVFEPSVLMVLLGSDEEVFEVENNMGHRIAALACSSGAGIGSRQADLNPFGDVYISSKTVLKPSTCLLQGRFQVLHWKGGRQRVLSSRKLVKRRD
jgi:hypothetical protein